MQTSTRWALHVVVPTHSRADGRAGGPHRTGTSSPRPSLCPDQFTPEAQGWTHGSSLAEKAIFTASSASPSVLSPAIPGALLWPHSWQLPQGSGQEDQARGMGSPISENGPSQGLGICLFLENSTHCAPLPHQRGGLGAQTPKDRAVKRQGQSKTVALNSWAARELRVGVSCPQAREKKDRLTPFPHPGPQHTVNHDKGEGRDSRPQRQNDKSMRPDLSGPGQTEGREQRIATVSRQQGPQRL